MEVRFVSSLDPWNTFFENHAPESGAFFYLESGKHVVWFDGDKLIGIGRAEEKHTPFGSYVFFPRGPLCASGVSLEDMLRAARPLFPRAIFFRFEPVVRAGCGDTERAGCGDPAYIWARKVVDVDPSETLILDLDRSLDEILSAMHSKTRYNIRLAERKGLLVRTLSSEEFPLAWKLFEETARRDEFRLHPREHYLDLLRNSAFHLIGVWLGEELLAAHLMVDAFGTRTYLHGASSSEHREVMAPYLLQWRQISEARGQGLLHYDFWGISKTNPKWAGITRFKLGFSGRVVSYPGTFDMCWSLWFYRSYQFFRAWRRFI